MRLVAARSGREAARPGHGKRMSEQGLRETLWQRLEGALDAFHDTDREVLPVEAWRFILYFARQARGPFLLLLLVGGLAGAVDAALYWSVGWLIDLLESSRPQTLRCTTARLTCNGTKRSDKWRKVLKWAIRN